MLLLLLNKKMDKSLSSRVSNRAKFWKKRNRTAAALPNLFDTKSMDEDGKMHRATSNSNECQPGAI